MKTKSNKKIKRQKYLKRELNIIKLENKTINAKILEKFIENANNNHTSNNKNVQLHDLFIEVTVNKFNENYNKCNKDIFQIKNKI